MTPSPFTHALPAHFAYLEQQALHDRPEATCPCTLAYGRRCHRLHGLLGHVELYVVDAELELVLLYQRVLRLRHDLCFDHTHEQFPR